MAIMKKPKIEYRDGSLIITPELCEWKNACREGVAFFYKHFPQGVTPKEIMTGIVRHVPMSFCGWGYHNLPFSESDKEEFLKWAEIKDSDTFYTCHHITNCHRITESHFCEDSSDIEKSSDVSCSSFVKNSTDVVESCAVFSSTSVEHSQKVMNSKHIRSGYFIINSDSCSASSWVSDSSNLNGCFFVDKCSESEDLLFCKNFNQAKNRIFCDAPLLPYEYAIFNKQVSSRIFERVKSDLIQYLVYWFGLREENIFPIENFEKTNPLALVFWEKLLNTEDFWTTIADIIPNFDNSAKEIAYSLTFCPKIYT